MSFEVCFFLLEKCVGSKCNYRIKNSLEGKEILENFEAEIRKMKKKARMKDCRIRAVTKVFEKCTLFCLWSILKAICVYKIQKLRDTFS